MYVIHFLLHPRHNQLYAANRTSVHMDCSCGKSWDWLIEKPRRKRPHDKLTW